MQEVEYRNALNNFYRTGSKEIVEIIGVMPNENTFKFIGIVHGKNGSAKLRFFSKNGIAKLGSNGDLNIISHLPESSVRLAISLVGG